MATPVGWVLLDTSPPSAPSGLAASAVSSQLGSICRGLRRRTTWGDGVRGGALSGGGLFELRGGDDGDVVGVERYGAVAGDVVQLSGAGAGRGWESGARIRAVATAVTPAAAGQPAVGADGAWRRRRRGRAGGSVVDGGDGRSGVASYEVERCQGAGCSWFRAGGGRRRRRRWRTRGWRRRRAYSYRVRARGHEWATWAPIQRVASATTAGSPRPPPRFRRAGPWWRRSRSMRGRGRRWGMLSGNGNVGVVEGASWSTAGRFGGRCRSTGRMRGCGWRMRRRWI